MVVRRNRDREGFTLLETVIALGVLAFGLLTLAVMQLAAMKGHRHGRHTSDAMAIAQTKMEEFQSMDFADADLAVTAPGWSAAETRQTDVDSPNGVQTEQAYELDWRVADHVANWTKDIDVRVQWDEPDNPGRIVVISTRLYNW